MASPPPPPPPPGKKPDPAGPRAAAGKARRADPPPATYKPTLHDPADTRVHGRMKGDEDDPRIRCPKDSMYMEKVTVGGLEIDRCAGCGSMWFDALELDRILASKDSASLVKNLDVGATGRHTGVRALGGLVCPRDRSPLIRLLDVKQSHIEELACTVCGGILLDRGELKDLSEYTLRERLATMLEKLRRK